MQCDDDLNNCLIKLHFGMDLNLLRQKTYLWFITTSPTLYMPMVCVNTLSTAVIENSERKHPNTL